LLGIKYDDLVKKGKLDKYLENKKLKQDKKLMMAYHKIAKKTIRKWKYIIFIINICE
jgi:hypothetical protein